MIRRRKHFGIDRAVASQTGQIVFGQQRIVVFRPEKIGGEIIGLQKRCEIVPHERPVAYVRSRVLAVFARLADNQLRIGRALDVTVNFGG